MATKKITTKKKQSKRDSFETLTKVTPAMIEHWKKLSNPSYLKKVMESRGINPKTGRKKTMTAKKTTTKKVSSCVKKITAIRRILKSK